MATTILIVEDDMIIAMDIQSRLESAGYEVCGIVSSGRDAIAKAREDLPDLIIMDIGLKGPMNGIVAARAIRREMRVPVVYITGNSDLLRQTNLTEPFDFLNKPFSDLDLMVMLEKVLPKGKALTSHSDSHY